MQKGKPHLVSVIITTKNEEDVIKRLLESIKNQSYKRIETILVDNNSTDETKNIAKRYSVSMFNYGPERSAQRNYGIKKAKGKLVMILDADMKLSKDVIKECVDEIDKDQSLAAIVIPEKSIGVLFWEKVKSFERSFYNLEGDIYTDAARFFRKKLIEEVGGYDETITGPEDWDLPETVEKRGYKISRIRSLIYHYERIPSIYKLIKKKFYYGLKSHRYLSKQKISIVSPKTIYLLRPVFYKNWKRLISHPILSTSMFILLFLELFAGGLGYSIGRIKNE